MLTLALDTSGEICAIAVADDDRLLAERHFYHNMNLLQRLVPAIEDLTSEIGREASEVGCVVVSLGPGSFTGLRIGMTVAKSLAYVNKATIVGIPTLDALAAGCMSGSFDVVCPMVHARAGEVYWTAFEGKPGKRLFDYSAASIDSVLDSLGDCGKFLFCGSGARRNWEAITERLGEQAVLAESWADFPRGAVLLELGKEAITRGEQADAMTLTPMYVKKPTPVLKMETSGKRKVEG